MRLVKETQGETLVGAIDGTNTTYTTSQTVTPTLLSVYVNGRLKVSSLDDGYLFVAPTTIVLKEPLRAGDTLEVEYACPDLGGGGGPLPPGVPPVPSAITLRPTMITGLIKPVGVYPTLTCKC